MSHFVRFTWAAVVALSLAPDLRSGVVSTVSVDCLNGSQLTGSSFVQCAQSTRAEASASRVFAIASPNGFPNPGDRASASVTSTFLLTFFTTSPGEKAAYFTPCFSLSMDARSGGGVARASFTSPAGSLSTVLSAPPAIQMAATCFQQDQTYLPFQYGVTESATISISVSATGAAQTESAVEVRFDGFRIFDSPGVLASGATAVISDPVPEPSTCMLMLIGFVLLMLRIGK